MCMVEGGNLIKQADRRRKQEWWSDKDDANCPWQGLCSSSSPRGGGVAGEDYGTLAEAVIKQGKEESHSEEGTEDSVRETWVSVCRRGRRGDGENHIEV